MTSKVNYLGNLRTSCVHLKSNNEIITDAPTDNNGKGEAFSPTDLVATALASCMLTIMGIKANQMNISIDSTMASVTKIMTDAPRRIHQIKIIITMPKDEFSQKDKAILEAAALTCPVAKSIHPEIIQTVEFSW